MRSAIIAICAALLCAIAFMWLTDVSPNEWTIRNFPVSNNDVLCFGDSLVTGVGTDRASGNYPSHLRNLLPRKAEVTADGHPGCTAEEGLQLLRDSNRHFTGGTVIVTLGGNDILQHIPWERTETALEGIFRFLQERGAMVVFTGVQGPLGGVRGQEYMRLCERMGVVLVPDVLSGILGNSELSADPVHPNADGYRLMAERVMDVAGFFITERPE